MKNKKGFTLLELLVVVVIIGILAAIALPQYKLAVDKAEFAKYQSMVSSLRDAYDEYVMLHGKGTKNFEDLSFTIPDSFSVVRNDYYGKCVEGNDMWCCMRQHYQWSGSSWDGQIYCGKKDEDFSIIYLEYLYTYAGEQTDRTGKCVAEKNNTRANRLCNNIGTNKTNASSGIVTPERIDYNYFIYTIK